MRERLSRLEASNDSLRRETSELREALQECRTDRSLALRAPVSPSMALEDFRAAYEMGLPNSLDITLSGFSRPELDGLPGPHPLSGLSTTVDSISTTTHSGRVMESSFWAFQYASIEDGTVEGSLGALRVRRGVAGKTHLLEWASKNGASYFPEFKNLGFNGETTNFACKGFVTVKGSGHVFSKVCYGRNKKDAERLVIEDLLLKMFGIPLEKQRQLCL